MKKYPRFVAIRLQYFYGFICRSYLTKKEMTHDGIGTDNQKKPHAVDCRLIGKEMEWVRKMD